MSQVGVHENYLGGDAQVATQVVLHDVGALLSLLRPPLPPSGAGGITLTERYVGAAIIFRDPIGASGAACDCDALLRLINVRTRPQMQNSAHETQMRSLSLDCAGAQHCQCHEPYHRGHADQRVCRRSQLGRR